MSTRYVLMAACVISVYILAKIALGYSWDTHLVALVATWVVSGVLVYRNRVKESR
jgi:hypothetical protein